MTQPIVNLKQSGSGFEDLKAALQALQKNHVLVGVPETDAAERQQALINKAQKLKPNSTRRAYFMKQAAQHINNAQLVFIHTNGSPLRHIPARPIIEAAIEVSGNRDEIANEMSVAAALALDGNPSAVVKQLRLTGLLAQNLVRAWFTDPRNHWAPNAPATIRRKGSDRPLIDTGEMRKSITYVVEERQ